MDAIDFLKKAKELCTETNCARCKISILCDGDPCSYRDMAIEQVVAHVERWAENPIKTNAQKFAEVFGVNLTLENKQACPPHRYTFACDGSGGDECRECQKWWGEPYKEPKGEE